MAIKPSLSKVTSLMTASSSKIYRMESKWDLKDREFSLLKGRCCLTSLHQIKRCLFGTWLESSWNKIWPRYHFRWYLMNLWVLCKRRVSSWPTLSCLRKPQCLTRKIVCRGSYTQLFSVLSNTVFRKTGQRNHLTHCSVRLSRRWRRITDLYPSKSLITLRFRLFTSLAWALRGMGTVRQSNHSTLELAQDLWLWSKREGTL